MPALVTLFGASIRAKPSLLPNAYQRPFSLQPAFSSRRLTVSVRFSGLLISSDQTSGLYSKVDIYRDITLLLRPRSALAPQGLNPEGQDRRGGLLSAQQTKVSKLARLVQAQLHKQAGSASGDALSCCSWSRISRRF